MPDNLQVAIILGKLFVFILIQLVIEYQHYGDHWTNEFSEYFSSTKNDDFS